MYIKWSHDSTQLKVQFLISVEDSQQPGASSACNSGGFVEEKLVC